MILAVLNQKGGAGKTVLSTNLAGAFQKSGASLLLIDSDFQVSSILWRALSPEGYPKVVHATTPSAISQTVHASQASIMIIDGAAQLQEPMSKAIAMATHVLVPVTPSALDMWAAEPLLEEARSAEGTRISGSPSSSTGLRAGRTSRRIWRRRSSRSPRTFRCYRPA